MAHQEHKERAPKALAFGVLTVSDTRDEASDETGGAIRRLLEAAGHAVAAYAVVRDEPAQIRGAVKAWLQDGPVQAVVVNGGSGVSPRDVTPEAVRPLLDKELPGFGELFRALSYQEIGAATYLSRAFAGVAKGKAVFCLPGSTAAAVLAVERLILPEAGHLWAMANEDGNREKRK
jgi:molybdenum cofactor biosynthesis protein B